MTDLDTYQPTGELPAPAAIGQATAVEQARAVAQVRAQMATAHDYPRSLPAAVAEMRESCGQKALAERAFFRYSRGGGQITGPAVHLARELARCFRNIDYGIVELSRDDVKGESEMLAYAWDIQNNTRASTTFIVKHGRDTKNGVKALTDMRDIYENNANNGARRLREQIFAVLPKWFTEEAQDVCRKTLEKGGDVPLPQRIATLVDSFSKSVGVSIDQLERKIGRRRDQWTAFDVASLTVIGKSIANGEARVDDEFPDEAVSADDIKPAARRTTRAAQPPADPNEPTDAELREMSAEMGGDR